MGRLRDIAYLAAFAFAVAALPALADSSSHHRVAEEPAGGHGSGEPGSGHDLGSAWAALRAARDAIAADLEAGRLDTIHAKAEPIPGLARALLEHSGDLEPAKRARLEGAVRQLSSAANELHTAADGGDAAATRRALGRLDTLLRLVEAQYPEGRLSSRATDGSPAVAGTAEPHGSHGTGSALAGHQHVSSAAQVAEPAQASILVEASEFRFQPDRISLRAGEPTRIRFENRGAAEHAFVVSGDTGGEAIHLHAQTGASDEGTFRLENPGSYQVRCTIPGHAEAGMLAQLVVEPAP